MEAARSWGTYQLEAACFRHCQAHRYTISIYNADGRRERGQDHCQSNESIVSRDGASSVGDNLNDGSVSASLGSCNILLST